MSEQDSDQKVAGPSEEKAPEAALVAASRWQFTRDQGIAGAILVTAFVVSIFISKHSADVAAAASTVEAE